jgi:hypothetical protein
MLVLLIIKLFIMVTIITLYSTIFININHGNNQHQHHPSHLSHSPQYSLCVVTPEQMMVIYYELVAREVLLKRYCLL